LHDLLIAASSENQTIQLNCIGASFDSGNDKRFAEVYDREISMEDKSRRRKSLISLTVPTIERRLSAAVFCAIGIINEIPSIESTSDAFRHQARAQNFQLMCTRSCAKPESSAP
jgi:hypothetical protein